MQKDMKPTFSSIVGAIALGAVALTCFDAQADLPESVRELIESGDFDEAIRMAEEGLAEAPEGKGSGVYYQVLGEAQYYAPGHRRESALNFTEARQRGVSEASLFLGRLAMLDFNFGEAQRLFGEYANAQRKAKRQLDPDLAYDQADAAEGARQFERMQDIVVIDAVNVPRQDFFKHLRLPLSAGRVVDIEELSLPADGRERGRAAYVSESGDLMMWTEMNDSTGMLSLVEATRLMDGSLSAPQYAPDWLGQEGDVINPFLSADGTTLYFAANGDNSVGGYDIFLATRDPQTGEYLQPVNAGIPFNSAADEYVMAIDEENGVGWWATDRHYLTDGKVTLYVYILPEERRTLNADDEEKRLRARLDDIRLTWVPPAVAGTDDDEEEDDDDSDGSDASSDHPAESEDPAVLARRYNALAAEIRKIQPGQKPRRHDCTIPIGQGRYIYSAEEVSTPEQRQIVQDYIAAEKRCRDDEKRLSEMRRDYARQSSRALSGEISALEEGVEKQRKQITELLSNLYRLLGAR